MAALINASRNPRFVLESVMRANVLSMLLPAVNWGVDRGHSRQSAVARRASGSSRACDPLAKGRVRTFCGGLGCAKALRLGLVWLRSYGSLRCDLA